MIKTKIFWYLEEKLPAISSIQKYKHEEGAA